MPRIVSPTGVRPLDSAIAISYLLPTYVSPIERESGPSRLGISRTTVTLGACGISSGRKAQQEPRGDVCIIKTKNTRWQDGYHISHVPRLDKDYQRRIESETLVSRLHAFSSVRCAMKTSRCCYSSDVRSKSGLADIVYQRQSASIPSDRLFINIFPSRTYISGKYKSCFGCVDLCRG